MLSKTLQVVADPDNPEELLLDLTNELCEQLGWQVGDTIEWIDRNDGSWELRKKDVQEQYNNSTDHGR